MTMLSRRPGPVVTKPKLAVKSTAPKPTAPKPTAPKPTAPKPAEPPVAANGFPASMGACADLLHEVRSKRLEADKIAKTLKEKEDSLIDHIINNLSKSKDTTGAAGKTHRVQLLSSIVPTVSDWPKLHAYIIEHERVDLLQRRVAEKAIEELWEAGEEIDGVAPFKKLKVSLTKL